MRLDVVVGFGCAMVLAGAVAVMAFDDHELSGEELRSEMVRNHAMATYIKRNGTPDLAESRFMADTPPWDDHEVTLYYLDRRKEISFARAYILGRPEVQITHYERPLTAEQVEALRARAQRRPLYTDAVGAGPAERAELAARRAEDAAGRVESAAGSAERAAERAESIVSRMEGASRRGRK